MHRSVLAAVGASIAVLATNVVALQPATAATAPLVLGRWVADPAGADKPNNTYRNRETIAIRNTTAKPLKVAGYRVRDKQKHTFVFPRGYILGARKTVTLHSGKGTNTAGHVYWKQGQYVWNNTGDSAYLQTSSGKTLDTCTYRRGGTITC